MYDPQTRIVTSMFAGNNENQWLDQVEEEFGSNLLDHNKGNGNGNGTTTMIEIDKNAKESLAKEMRRRIPIWKAWTPARVSELTIRT
jgi:hypothetical protein